jgi:hypothetical protein
MDDHNRLSDSAREMPRFNPSSFSALNLYTIEYNGSWLGGVMLVLAKDKADALRVAYRAMEPRDIPSTKIVRTVPLPAAPAVLYNDNGEY